MLLLHRGLPLYLLLFLRSCSRLKLHHHPFSPVEGHPFSHYNYHTPVSDHVIFFTLSHKHLLLLIFAEFLWWRQRGRLRTSDCYGGSGSGGCGGVSGSAASASSSNLPDLCWFAQSSFDCFSSNDHAISTEAIILNSSCCCSWIPCSCCHFNWPTISWIIPFTNC